MCITRAIFVLTYIAIMTSCASTVPRFQPQDNGTVNVVAPDSFDIKHISEWSGLSNFLTTTPYKTYIIEWGGYGGSVDMGKTFIHSLQEARSQGKTIIFKLREGAYSMHAVAACYANSIQNPKDHVLMFHMDGRRGKRTTPGTTWLLTEFNYCNSRGILSNESMNQLFSGHEVYVSNGYVRYEIDPRTPEE